MGRGLGKIQKKIIEILEEENGYYDVGSLIYQVVHGKDCFEQSNPLRAPTVSEKQSIWRSLRTLEDRNRIESKIKGVSRYRGAYKNNSKNPSIQKMVKLIV